nr:ribonuclease H-like domain-containing protein [Tanacetum cinerariifolium]
MWKLRIEQYFYIQDYALWDVIEKGNPFKPVPQTTTNADGTSTLTIPGPVTTKEKAQKKNDVKARSMLLMALPNEHLLKFSQYKDANTLFDAIQKIVSQLAILGENVSQEDLNMKFLRSFPSEWNTHVVWRNKADLDKMSIDDLYNNFKIVKQEVKKEQLPQAQEEMDLKWQLALLCMRAKRWDILQGNAEVLGIKKQAKESSNSRKTVNVEDTSSKAMMAIDGADGIKTCIEKYEKGMVQRVVSPVWNNAMRTNQQNFSNSRRNFTPKAVLTKSSIVPISTARQSSSRAAAPGSAIRPINTAASTPLVNVAKPRQNALQITHSLSRRPFYQQTSLKNRNLHKNVNAAKVNSVNTAKGNKVTSVVGNQGTNAVKSSACWVWRPKIKVQDHVSKKVDHTFVSNLTMLIQKADLRNISYLTDFKEHDRGYVTFGGGAKGGKIISKGTIRTGKLDFEDVYFVKELQFNRFSVSQMCDEKNSVLFADTNRVINEFCEEKGIKREFSVAKTPQQNEVAERRNRTLIEAVRTMVVVVKPHFKTPYELFKGRSPALSFTRPFRCHVSILNTLDQIGNFDGKLDERIFVGYSTTSKTFRVYNIRTRKVEENLHITFLENKSMIIEIGSSQDYILIPLWKENSLFDSSSQASDGHNKDKHGPSQVSESVDQERPNDPLMPDLEDVRIFDDVYDDRDEGAEADYNNLETIISVSPIPSTRIHKDHLKEHIIREVNSTVQTRKMDKQRRTNHKDFQNCLFACFLSHMEPKKVTQALDDKSLVEAMQEELLQFKLLNVWTLVDFSPGKRAIELNGSIETREIKEGLLSEIKLDSSAHQVSQASNSPEKNMLKNVNIKLLSPTKPEQDLPSRPSALIIEDWVSDSEEEDMPQLTKDVPSFSQSPELVKSPRHSGLLSPSPMTVAPSVLLRKHSPSKGLKRAKKTCFVCKSETRLIKDCDFHARKLAYKSYASRDIHKTVSAVKPKFSKNRPNIASYAMSKSKSPLRMPFIRHPSPKPSISPPRVNAAKPSAVSASQNNHGKWVWKPKCLILDHALRTSSASMTLKRFDYNDALGRSKNMIGNMSYLSDFKELNGGYVAFGVNPKGGKITGKENYKVFFRIDTLTEQFRKSQFDVMFYQTGLESVEARLQTSDKEGLGYNSKVFTQAMFDYDNYYSSERDNDSWSPSNLYDSPTKHEQDLPSTSSAPIIEDWVSDSEEEYIPQVTKDVPSLAQSPELVNNPRHSGLISPPPMSVAPHVSLRPYSPLKGLKRLKKTCFVCKSETHLIKDCDFHARKLAQKSYASMDIHNHHAQIDHSRIPFHKVTTAARTIGAARPTFSKPRPHITPYTVSKFKSPIRRPFIRHASPKPSISPLRVNVAKPSAVSAARVNAANPFAVSAARVNAAKLSTVRAARINDVKPSAVTAVQHNHTKKGNPQQALKDKGVIDSRCSRHMIGNISYLSDFEELNGGYVAFGGNPKGGKITGKGKIKTGKLDFDDVYYVKELKFNLLSVSQMYDKRNNVLFTDTECLVLYSDFKLPDASQVLLRVPRENNMYNVNLKNIIPSGDLTCLFAKATLDESNLWHRRLGHVNFKTINKLVKRNLVRGLPSKVFTNDLTCVACKKGKQHRASCKSKTNKVLVTKPHHKTPYELLHGRLPSIGFMRPFGCHVTILNTLDPLGKFQGKVDEGFLVGYSVYSKAFRSLPDYELSSVLAENQTNSNAGFQELEKARDEGTQTYVLFHVLSDGSTNPKNNKDAHTSGNEHNDDIQKSVSPDIHSSSCGDQEREQGDKAMNKDKGKNPVTITGFRDLNEEFTKCINNSSNGVSAAGPSVSTARLDFTNSTNDFIAVGPLVSAADLNFTNSTNDFSVAGPSNAAMPNMEDLSHNADDVGAEADTNNMESIILVRPIPTTRIHKHYLTSQIIGDLSSTTQTRSMARGVRDQGGILHMFNEDFHTYMFACFLSQEEPKRIHQALKDPSWIEAIQEELLQFKTLSKGKSASTPIDAEKPLLKNSDGKDVDVHTYRSMIGSLMYLTSSRPDIMFAVCACARFQVTPKVSHLNVVKRIFRDLKGKPLLGLWYPKDSPFDLVAYLDSDYAGESLDRKSTTRGCQFLGCRLISWQCKKQTVVATSSTKSEYVAAASGWQTTTGKESSNPFMAVVCQKLYCILFFIKYAFIYIHYALTVSPHIYISCIKQFWNTAVVKRSGDVTRVGKGFSRVETHLFENMLEVREVDAEEEVQERINVDIDEGIELVVDQEKESEIEGRQADTQVEIYNIDLDHSSMVLSMQEDDAEVDAASTPISTAKPAVVAVSTPISVAKPAAKPKTREEMGKEKEEIIKSINDTPAQKAAKRKRLREQAKEDENLKKQLEVVVDKDDDVFIEAAPIGRKDPVINYEIVMINNKPRHKIIRADDTHQLYTSFITLLKNFNREDLEDLSKIVKARQMHKMLYGEVNRLNMDKLWFTLELLVNVARLQVNIVGNKIHKAFPLPGESSHWQYKFPLPAEGVPTARRLEIPLPGVCTAMMKKLPESFSLSMGTSGSSLLSKDLRVSVIALRFLVNPSADCALVPTSTDSAKSRTERTITPTTEDMQKKKNDVKARTTLLLSLPDEHQLRFSKYKTAKELWAAILKTFGDIEKDDLNQKFLTSLAPEWLIHTIVWRNRNDIDSMSLDDLYNHLKVYETEVQKKPTSNPQDMEFISSSKNSNNEDGNTLCVTTATTPFPTGSVNVATISQDTA